MSYLFEKRGRTLRTMVLGRILIQAADELLSLSENKWTREAIRDMAWSTRSLFELLLLYRHVRESDQKLESFVVEQRRDEIDIYESLKALSDREDDQKWCEQRIEQLVEQARCAELAIPRRPQRISDIATAVGMEDEYRAVYKLYSKWVHPTSWRIVSGGSMHEFLEEMSRQVLIGRAYAYAHQLVELAGVDSIEDGTTPALSPFDRPLPKEAPRDEFIAPLFDPELEKLLKSLRELDTEAL